MTSKRKRPQNDVTYENIPVEYTYWRNRPSISRVNAEGHRKVIRLSKKAYDARTLMTMITGGLAFFPDNREPMTPRQMVEISIVVGIARRDRKVYRETIKSRNTLQKKLSKLTSTKRKLDQQVKETNGQIHRIRDELSRLRGRLGELTRTPNTSPHRGSPVGSSRASPANVMQNVDSHSNSWSEPFRVQNADSRGASSVPNQNPSP